MHEQREELEGEDHVMITIILKLLLGQNDESKILEEFSSISAKYELQEEETKCPENVNHWIKFKF